MLMKIFNIKKIICALLVVCLTSCTVEYAPAGYYRYSGLYRPYYNYYNCRRPTITPVAHGFDPAPQYVRGFVFRGNDGMPYAAEF